MYLCNANISCSGSSAATSIIDNEFFNVNNKTMNYQRNLRIYEYISYFLIIAATVVYFIFRNQGPATLNLTLVILVLAVASRMMMERTRRQAADAENDELKNDLRRLTQLYAEEKKKNQNK